MIIAVEALSSPSYVVQATDLILFRGILMEDGR